MNGIVVIDKPSGKTSHDVVEYVKKALSVKKAGHTGTLDPMATGVLPVCINEATKLVQFFTMDTKDYTATMLLGVRSDTQDLEGTIISRDDSYVSVHDIENVMYRFVGRIEQVPPRYSAIKFRGKSLYKWARKGVTIDPPSRSVEIFQIVIREVKLPYVTFSMSCSKGTYIRTLCSDIGDILGCGACLAGLRRTRSGCFSESSAVLLDGSIKNNIAPEHIISLVDALPNLSAMYIGHAFAKTPIGFGVARAALGVPEAGNFPAAIKATAEDFPKKDRARNPLIRKNIGTQNLSNHLPRLAEDAERGGRKDV
ncbi:MAG: tRNA pseudouridine(55) synthase TruB [Syntrophaceae bacterium]|nr:tRNA pseudouridine(55) synthase TruB [Syntrophaceae bacterium]